MKDPDSRNNDKLKASELVFEWLELGAPRQTRDTAIDTAKLTLEELKRELSTIVD